MTEFSRVVRVEPLPRAGLEQTIEANAQERAALARLNNLPDIAELKATLRIAKWRRGVKVEGDLHAKVTQTCVVSLEPFEAEIDEPVEVRFLPEEDGGVGPESLDEDAPDALIDGKVDLGAIASEFLTLALDPYPRKPGVAFEPPPAEDDPTSPFERLRALSGRQEPD
jgi:uncharacterized metal-binding protein YceD (DUF177 family)